MNVRRQLLSGAAIWLAIAAIGLLYWPGLSAGFFFDDPGNLSGLNSVNGVQTALSFVFSGEAGPLGRPFSLASFLPNAGDWPDHPAGFARVSILIHLLNGLLAIWLFLKLAEALPGPESNRRRLVLILGAVLWMVLPIQVSANLIPVQRMTTLSATFVLAGLLAYATGRLCESTSPIKGVLLQIGGIGLGTLLAVLSKENGALLPAFALVLELTLLRMLGSARWLDRVRLLLLALPVLAIVTYLLMRLPGAQGAYQYRDFTLGERLLTQPVILWDYLRLAFLPRPFLFHPFYENFPHSTGLFSPPTTFLALAAWVVSIGAALRYRKLFPALALAVFWFFAGHLVESTTIPLELYFQHRNYVPLIGPCLALAWTVSRIPQRLAPVLFASYVGIIAFVLLQTTSLWGDRHVAAEIWHKTAPESARAAQHLAMIYNNELRDHPTALRVFDRAIEHCPDCGSLHMQAAMISCAIEDSNRFRERINTTKALLSRVRDESSAINTLHGIFEMIERGSCPHLEIAELRELNQLLLNNPHYGGRNRYGRQLHRNLYFLCRAQGDLDCSIRHLQAAWRLRPQLEIAALITWTFMSAGLYEDAQEFLQQARSAMPDNSFVRATWASSLDSLNQQVMDADNGQAIDDHER